MHFHVASALRDTSSASQWNTTTTAPATVHHPVHLRLLFVPKLDYLLSFNSSKSIPPGLFFEQKKKLYHWDFCVVESWANYYHGISPFLLSVHYFSLVVRLPRPRPLPLPLFRLLFFSSHRLHPFRWFLSVVAPRPPSELFHSLCSLLNSLPMTIDAANVTGRLFFHSSNLNECVSQWPTTCSPLPFIRNSPIDFAF